jgi:hypothetical protein
MKYGMYSHNKSSLLQGLSLKLDFIYQGAIQKANKQLTELFDYVQDTPIEVSDLLNKITFRQAQRPNFISFWTAP